MTWRPFVIASAAYVVLMFHSGCGDPHAEIPRAGAVPDEVMVDFFRKGECRPATDFMESWPAAERAEDWYRYRSQVHLMCGERELNSPEDTRALLILDEGLKRYPDSSTLRATKASIYQSLGDQVSATRMYQEAEEVAKRNIAAHGSNYWDDLALRQIEHGRRRNVQTPAEPTGPTIHIDTSKEWPSRVTALAEEGKCEDAIKLLSGIRPDRPLWYAFMAEISAACFTEGRGEHHKTAARQQIEAGIREYPESVRLHFTRARIHQTFGNTDMAKRYYEETERMARAAADSRDPAVAHEAAAIIESLRAGRE